MNRRSALAGLVLAGIEGCASPPRLMPLAAGSPLRIVVTRAQADGPVPIRNQALGDGVSTGAGSGALTGGLLGLSCGPLLVLCVPLGALAGLVSGTGVGAVVGASGALADDQAGPLRRRVDQVRLAHDLVEVLRRNVVERAGQRWILSSDSASATLTLELQALKLTSTRDDRISLVVQVLATLLPAAGPAAKPPPPKVYEYVGPLAPLAVWLDESSDFLDTSFDNAGSQIAAQVIGELAQR